MKKSTSLRQHFLTALLALAMWTVGQSAWAVFYTPLRGTAGFQNSESYASLVDGQKGTKWCTDNTKADYRDGWYIIFKASEPMSPSAYQLTTGGDTESYPGRNWKDWTISGANFDSEDDAVFDSDKWTVIDKKEGVGPDQLPAANVKTVTFEMSEVCPEEYEYFMIHVSSVVDGTTMQMIEFNFGKTEAIEFTALDGTAGFSDGEGFAKLVDGNSNNKWCSNNTHDKYDNGWWITFKASRAFAPYYYMLATSNDTGGNPDRNWVNWSIFGANFDSEAQCTKNSDAWVLLDLKQNIGPEDLSNASWTASFFDLNQYQIEEFEYFKVEIYSSGGDLQQMSELTLGPKEDFPQVANKLYLDLVGFNADVLCTPALLDEYKTLLAAMRTSEDMTSVLDLRKRVIAKQSEITACASAYNTLKTQAEMMANFAEKQEGLEAAARKVLSDYATQNIAPNDIYPNGSWPYILENLSLSAAELATEYEFACAMYEEQSSQIVEDPIEAVFEPLTGTYGFSDTESFGSLLDGMEDTKWCANKSHEGYDNGWWIVFKASEPVKPSMYKLVTGNDTEGSPDRNWVNWSIFGANFDSDEAAEKNAEGWVLIDKKENVGTDMLPAANFATAFFNMSEVVTEPYKYFKLEIYKSGGDLQQMGELVLGNRGNIAAIRDGYYEECSAFEYDVICQKSLTDRYAELLAKLQVASNVNVVASYYNELKSIQGSIPSSVEAYSHYVDTVAYVRNVLEVNTELAGFNFDKLMTYLEESIEPNATYPNGSYAYIMENRLPDATEIGKESNYVGMLLEAALNSSYAPLDGTAGFGANEGYAGLVDGSSASKWCTSTDKDKYDNGWWAIFKTLNPITPAMYTLTTANDTQSNPGRNWKTWNIYGGNFESNEAATKDAEGWVLIDQKSGIGQDRLGATNFVDYYFGLSEEITEEYQYFKIEVTEIYSGTTMQMGEFLWGTQDDFFAIRDQKCSELERDLNVNAQASLLEAYEAALEELGNTENIEAMVVVLNKVNDLGAQIDASVSAYENYLAVTNEIAVFLEENPALQGEARDLLESYLNDFLEPGEQFPNGSMFFITEECPLDVDQLKAETAYAQELQRNVVKTCYVAGTDLTSLLSDPDFLVANSLAGWDNTGRWDPANPEEGISVARNYYNKQETLSQTLTGLKDGIYLVKCNGLFATFENKTSQVYGATFFANGNHVPLQLIIEDPQPMETAIDLENCYITEIGVDPYDNEIEGGYIPTKETGAGYALRADRYKNYILAKVTDGTLTLGYQVEGTATTDHDWAVVGHTKLMYCGTVEEASEGLATVLEGMAARATQMLNTEVSTGTDFAYYPSFNKDIRAGLEACIAEVENGTNEAKYELVERFSALFLQQFENVKAYSDLAAALTSLEDVVYNSTDYEFTEEQVNEFKTMYDEAWNNILEGNYTTEEAYAKDMIRKNSIYVIVNGVMPDQKDGIYQISSADELRWFATQVNGGNTLLKAVLTQDIDMSTQPNLAPIGTASHPFAGEFDGQGYKISNYSLEATAGRAGLFGTVEGKVGNFSIEGTLKCAGASNGAIAYADGAEIWGIHSYLNIDATGASITHTAGVVGDLDNASTITECAFYGTISAGNNNDCFGGVAGYTNTGVITNSANYGTITTDNVNCYAGGIVAYVNNKTPGVYNCLAVGKIECTAGATTYAGVLAGWLRSYTAENFQNNYYLASAGIRAAGGTIDDGLFTATDAETLASGSICYALNQNQNGEVWFQTLGSDATPVLDRTHGKVVLKDGQYVNDGTAIADINVQKGQKSIYTLQGVRVEKAQKGLYIIDGKKTLVK